MLRSVLTHGQGGRITSLCVLESSHAVASASSNGSVHVFKIEYAESREEDPTTQATSQTPGAQGVGAGQGGRRRFIGQTDIRRVEPGEEGAVLGVEHFNTVRAFSLGSTNQLR